MIRQNRPLHLASTSSGASLTEGGLPNGQSPKEVADVLLETVTRWRKGE